MINKNKKISDAVETDAVVTEVASNTHNAPVIIFLLYPFCQIKMPLSFRGCDCSSVGRGKVHLLCTSHTISVPARPQSQRARDWLVTAWQPLVARETLVFPDWLRVGAGSCCEVNC